jgi:hypothetical protein
MKYFIVFTILFLSLSIASGQGYNQAAGIRASWHSPGLEYRYYTSDVNAFKSLLSFRDRGLQLHGFAEFFRYDLFPFSHQLLFYYGFGAHAGFESWDEKEYRDEVLWYDTRSSFLAGLDGLAGLEYVFYEIPVSAGIEIKPFVDFLGRDGFDIKVFDLALTVKYLF